KKIKAENSHYAAEILFAMGDVKVAQLDNKGALVLIQKGCAMMEKGNDSANDPHTLAIGLHKLAALYQQMNRDDDAIAADEKAKAIEIGGINTSIRRLPKP
ncbi:MAG: hypothetical protein K2X81_12910, partial [Candidatus Obscuribacterales bacterium]|nr:hypothetical protein [Candidatus Obscuribacterales bacterium]